jgi:serine/threonine protein kinase
MPAQLTVIAGPDKGRSFPLKEGDTLLIGRGKNTGAPLTDPRVSRVHCQVKVEGGRFLLADLGGAGGTLVNGKAVDSHELEHDDKIQIGDSRLVFNDEEEEDEGPPTVPPTLPAERMHELTGYQLGRFEIGPLLAKGQSGLVFFGKDRKQDRPTAVKVFWPEFSRDAREVKRFVRAMKTMLPLRHPHLVTIYGAGRTGTYCWVAMEYVDGESMRQHLTRLGGAPPWQPALRVAVHLARALAFASFHKIVHRNIAPPNILISSRDRVVKLGDLMTAKALEGRLALHVTKPGELLGDVEYLAPEQTTGVVGEIDHRSDLYGLGATVYALLTGRPPLRGASMVETILKIRQENPVSPKQLNPAVPDALAAVVVKLLQKRPEDRYQNAGALLGELNAIAKAHGQVE